MKKCNSGFLNKKNGIITSIIGNFFFFLTNNVENNGTNIRSGPIMDRFSDTIGHPKSIICSLLVKKNPLLVNKIPLLVKIIPLLDTLLGIPLFVTLLVATVTILNCAYVDLN